MRDTSTTRRLDRRRLDRQLFRRLRKSSKEFRYFVTDGEMPAARYETRDAGCGLRVAGCGIHVQRLVPHTKKRGLYLVSSS
jgi:hypothetical protein